MDRVIKNYEDVDSWKTVMFLYQSALKEVGTKLEILNDEFQHVHQYNPIEHIKTRVKTAESIVKKLKRYGYETSIENMVKYINDIAGVRLICSFTSDIYRLAEMIGNQSDLKVLSIKDYIKNPKESGYKSYHMLVSVPIFLSDSVVDTKVEIQIDLFALSDTMVQVPGSTHTILDFLILRELHCLSEFHLLSQDNRKQLHVRLPPLLPLVLLQILDVCPCSV